LTPPARSFGAAADLYDRYRPGYAAAAAQWALGPRPLRVVDLGAGTGILSRLLHRLGHEVIAVEPDAQMRARIGPGISTLGGTAEEIPLRDASVDAAVAGQAHHWFDGARAHPEIARVLRPGGVLAALWNDADLSTQWTVRYIEIIDGSAPARPVSDFGERFTRVEVGEFPNDMWMTPDDLVAMARTRSPYLVASAAERHRMLAAVRGLLADPSLAGLDRFAMPHVTRVHRAYRA
jgi:SAM-dependent methyltransferase